MRKVLGVIAALAIVGASGIANAADAQHDSIKQSTEMSAMDMDNVTAGVGTSGTSSTPIPRTYTLGSYLIVWDGKTWTRVKK